MNDCTVMGGFYFFMGKALFGLCVALAIVAAFGVFVWLMNREPANEQAGE
jgi:hypothetical protein